MIEKFMMMTLALSQRKSERGATATEYALLVTLIAIALVVGVGFFGDQLDVWFDALGDLVQDWIDDVNAA